MIPRYGGPRALGPVHLLTRSFLRLHSTSQYGEVAQGSPAVSPLSTKVRTLMRTTPHPLTTVVAFPSKPSNPPQDNQHAPCGLLVSSFNTVTLHPTPHVSFNIKRPSATYDAIHQSGSFTASGLSSAAVADAFVKTHGASKALEHLVGNTGKLKDRKGGTWWMVCRLVKERCVEVGDHVVVVGEVMSANTYGDEKGRTGLIYAKGKYRKIGKVLEIASEEPEEALD